jgi:hypothetical protein
MPSVEGSERSKLRAGLDPRTRIQRDPYNEYLVFILSASGAAVIVPILLLIVAAFTGQPGIVLFLVLSVVLELALIFGLGRPAMLPKERVGWALLWGASAAALGACFYYLVLVEVV